MLLTASGHSFERRYIQKWLLRHKVCPVSKEAVADSSSALITNWSLKKVIQEWRIHKHLQLPPPTYKVVHSVLLENVMLGQ